jgi:hypothetical protein
VILDNHRYTAVSITTDVTGISTKPRFIYFNQTEIEYGISVCFNMANNENILVWATSNKLHQFLQINYISFLNRIKLCMEPVGSKNNLYTLMSRNLKKKK